MSWVFQSFEAGLFTVGFYTPDGQWVPESDHDTRDDAAVRCSYLNGGSLPALNFIEVENLTPTQAEALKSQWLESHGAGRKSEGIA